MATYSSEIQLVRIKDGEDGQGVSSVAPQYYLSSSDSSLTGGQWSDDPPTWNKDKYLWVRQKINYTNPTSIGYTSPVLDSMWNSIKTFDKNILIGYEKYSSSSPLILSSSETESHFHISDLYANLEEGIEYTLSAKTNGLWKPSPAFASLNNRSVGIWLFNEDLNYHRFFDMTSLSSSFVLPKGKSGKYQIGISLYSDGVTTNNSKFWDFAIEETSLAVSTLRKKMAVLQTDFEVEQGRIEQLIKSTTLDGEYFRDQLTQVTSTVGGITTTVADIQTDLNNTNDSLTSLTSKVTTIETTADGLTARITQAETDITNANNTASAASTQATLNAGKLDLLIQSGNDASSLVITPGALNAIARDINLTGKVTFTSLDTATQNKINSGISATNDLREEVMRGINLISGTSEYTKDSPLTVIGNRLDTWVYNDSCKIYLSGNDVYTFGIETNGRWKERASMAGKPDLLEVGCYLYNQDKDYHVYCDFSKGRAKIKIDPEYTGEYILRLDVYSDGKTNVSAKFWDFAIYNRASITNLKTEYCLSDSSVSLSNASWEATRQKVSFEHQYLWIRDVYVYSDGTKEYGDPKVLEAYKPGIVDQWSSQSETDVLNAVQNGFTTINGGFIQTSTIKADHLYIDKDLRSKVIEAINIKSQEVDAVKINADALDIRGMTVHNAQNVETLRVTSEGDITIRGDMESYNFNDGKTGWSIKRNGNAEFNDVLVRGSVVTNDGGIASSGGAGRNLMRYTAVSETNKSKWQTSFLSSFTVETFEGRACYKLVANSGTDTNRGINGSSGAISGQLALQPGKKYTFSFWAWSSIAGNFSHGTFGHIQCRNSDNSNVHCDINHVYSPSSIPANTWTYCTVIFEVNAASTFVPYFWYLNTSQTLRLADFKLEEGTVATSWSPAPEDNFKQVRFWAGASYEERENAPFIVYNDGSIKATKGNYSGLWTGDIQVGNISISDTSATAGNDALLKIQHGSSGIVAVELTDKDESIFRQDLSIRSSTNVEMISLSREGSGIFNSQVQVGTGANSSQLQSDRLNLRGRTLGIYSDGFQFENNVNVGSASNMANLTSYGVVNAKSDIILDGALLFGSVVKFARVTGGLNIDVL